MKISPNAFHKLFCSPLMLHAPTRQHLESALLSHMGMKPIADIGDPGRPMRDVMEFNKDWKATAEQMRVESVYQRFHNVAVVKIHGVIDKMITQFEMDCYGGCDLSDVDKGLALAESDARVDTVVLSLDTPGGSVVGTPETAARVARIRQRKEVHAFTETMCCSAGYYIASQADRIATAPSAVVGSIGVYMALIDATRQLDMDGIKVELIKAGRLKAMGASFKSLTDEERELLQGKVDRLHAEFKAACLTLRSIDDAVMQGQWFDGSEGVAAGIVDETTQMNLDEYVSQLIR